MDEPVFEYQTQKITAPRLGLIALQSDETIEGDLRRMLPQNAECLVSRVASEMEVTRETLASMERHLTAAAALFPRGIQFDAVGYGCTSGTAQIGPDQVAAKIRDGAPSAFVTQPLSALIAACGALDLKRLALLSPYVSEVSERLREDLSQNGVETPLFGSFDVGTEAVVVRIDSRSIIDAAQSLIGQSDTPVDALFLSCTNLRAIDVIEPLEAALGMPVLTSNQVLAWHLMRKTGLDPSSGAPGRLFAHMA